MDWNAPGPMWTVNLWNFPDLRTQVFSQTEPNRLGRSFCFFLDFTSDVPTVRVKTSDEGEKPLPDGEKEP